MATVLALPGLVAAQTLPRAAPIDVEITVPLRAAGDPDGFGAITVTAVGRARAMCYAIAVARIALPAQRATLFAGAAGGNNILVARLTPPNGSGTASGCVPADPALLTGLDTDPGGYYIEIATTEQPAGAVRGRLVQSRPEQPAIAQPRPAQTAPSATVPTPAPATTAPAATGSVPTLPGAALGGAGSAPPAGGATAGGAAAGSGASTALPGQPGTLPFAGTGPAGPVAPGTAGAHGFASGAGAGTERAQCTVTSLADSGSGTLRECAEQPGAATVNFSTAGTISLGAPIKVASDKTLDGGGQVALAGGGVQIDGVRNVVVRGFSFQQGSGDSIGLLGAFDQVWIDHNTFTQTADGSIDVTLTNSAPGYHQATISWNHFQGTDKTMLINPSPALDVNAHDDRLRLTVDHNFFDRTVQRNPLVHQAKVDLYNNYLSNWSAYGVNSYSQAQTWAEGNIYEAGPDKQAMNTGGNGPHSPGYAANVNNWLVNGAQFQENYPQGVFNPASYYQRRVDQPSQQLAYAVATQTGSRNSAAATPTLPGLAPTTTAPGGAVAPVPPGPATMGGFTQPAPETGTGTGSASGSGSGGQNRTQPDGSPTQPTPDNGREDRAPRTSVPERVPETRTGDTGPDAVGTSTGLSPSPAPTRTSVATATPAGQPLPIAVGEPADMPTPTGLSGQPAATEPYPPLDSVGAPTAP